MEHNNKFIYYRDDGSEMIFDEPLIVLEFQTTNSSSSPPSSFKEKESKMKEFFTENFGDPQEIKICIMCDICSQKYQEDGKTISMICTCCDKYFDYCKTHPTPQECPFCSNKTS